MNETSGKRQAEGRERIARIQDALKHEQLDAVVCTLPSSVLMISGYWPVIGTAISVATSDGIVAVLAPEDEEYFAEHGWAHRIIAFQPGALDRITTPALAASELLRKIAHEFKIHCARIGYEYGGASEPASYAGMHLYRQDVVDMLRYSAPSAALAPASDMLARLAASKTAAEVESIRLACRVAGESFEHGRQHLRSGAVETEVANTYRSGFSSFGMQQPGVLRADGFAWCMSGPNSAKAKGAFAYSTSRELQQGDLVLVHANNYVDGYWTDITRTQVLGEATDKQQEIFAAVEEARQAAFAKIRPGARAADVDLAAREVLRRHGYDKEFPHSTGHGVGFAAIAANALPRIHPMSDEILETGMTFNIEPAVYIENFGGVRHCDMVSVTSTGMELLTPFQPIVA